MGEATSPFQNLVDRVSDQVPFTVTVKVLVDSEPHRRLSELEEQLEEALLAPDDDDATTVGAEAYADQIRQLLAEHVPETFVFRQLSGLVYDDLSRAHVTDEGKTAPSFWPAVAAACCVTPEGADEDGFAALIGNGDVNGVLGSGQRETIIDALVRVNRGLTDLRPTSAATRLILSTRQTSTTAPPEESPDPGSSDE